MLLIKSKYKIAKRLGASVFEKTQSQKFALAESRTKPKNRRAGSDYGKQLLEKQRVRYTYGISEGQLSRYASEAMEHKDPSAALNDALELRVDNAVYRAGFASTRRAARQIVSHGHITVNGTRTTIPSHRLKKGDVIAVREGSRTSPLFAGLTEEKEERATAPSWISANAPQMRAEIIETPKYDRSLGGLDYATVFEFYSR